MSGPAYIPPPEYTPHAFVIQPPTRPYWLHLLLFLLAVLTTTIVGAKLQNDFNTIGDTYFFGDTGFFPIQWLWLDPHRLLAGIPFSATLLGILLAHEMGHFLYSVKHRVYATLPFFLPAPFISPIGTLGAFIKIQSPFRSRAALLEIGIAGPIAGFLVAVPFACTGLLMSNHLGPGADPAEQLGYPLIFQVLHWVMSGLNVGAPGHIPLRMMALHPVALAAWVGMLATALNLLPGGQLDGGHILFAWSPNAHRATTYAAIGVLGGLTLFFWTGWLVWILGLWITRHHPPVPARPELGSQHRLLLLCALALLALTFIPIPIPGGGLWQSIRNIHLHQ